MCTCVCVCLYAGSVTSGSTAVYVYPTESQLQALDSVRCYKSRVSKHLASPSATTPSDLNPVFRILPHTYITLCPVADTHTHTLYPYTHFVSSALELPEDVGCKSNQGS